MMCLISPECYTFCRELKVWIWVVHDLERLLFGNWAFYSILRVCLVWRQFRVPQGFTWNSYGVWKGEWTHILSDITQSYLIDATSHYWREKTLECPDGVVKMDTFRLNLTTKNKIFHCRSFEVSLLSSLCHWESNLFFTTLEIGNYNNNNK